jgi:hypothetical protein
VPSEQDVLVRWDWDGFKLTMWDMNDVGIHGKTRIGYEFVDTRYEDAEQNDLVFEGTDFYSPAHECPDSERTMWSLLSFLALGKGDTDREYFENYTPFQLEWRDSCRREELAMLVYEAEERLDREEKEKRAVRR